MLDRKRILGRNQSWVDAGTEVDMSRIEDYIGQAIREMTPDIDWETYEALPGAFTREVMKGLLDYKVSTDPVEGVLTMSFFEHATAGIGLDPSAVYSKAASLAREAEHDAEN